MISELSLFSYFIIFVSGLLIGSFLNVVVDRLQNGKSILFGKSECDFCKRKLTSKELVPVISYLAQRGRCLGCHKKFSLYYPIAEILTGLVFVALAVWLKVLSEPSTQRWFLFFFHSVVASMFIVIFLSDMKYMIVPDKIVIPAIIVMFVGLVLSTLLYLFALYKSLNSSEFGKYLIKAGFVNSHAILAFKELGATMLG
ncbi:prepilin peptidase, partial [candidate division WWE3 bacterium]|nr:prepilin peptidase [candidate division WWE3 bacterium]